MTEEEKKHFRPALIKELRIKNGHSLENVAQHLNLTRGEMSWMERGKRAFSPERFEKALLFYNFHFDEDDLIVRQLVKETRELLNYEYRLDVSSYNALAQSILSRHEMYEHSWSRYLYKSIEVYILSIGTPKYRSNKQIEEILSLFNDPIYMELLPKDFAGLVHSAAGEYYMRNKRVPEAEHHIEAALNTFQNQIFNHGREIVKIQKLRLLTRNLNTQGAIKTVNELRAVYASDGNYKRLLALSNQEAIFYMSLQEFQTAEEIILQVRADIKRIGADCLASARSENLVWCYLNLGKYHEAIQIIKTELVQIDTALETNLIFLPFCYYRIGDIEAALEVLEEFRTIDTDSEGKRILEIEEHLIRGRTRTYTRKSNTLIDALLRQNDYAMACFLLKIQIEYLEGTDENDLLLDSYRKERAIRQSRKKIEGA